MTASVNLAEAIRANALIDAAWDAWAKQEPKDGTSDEQDAWQAGYEAFEEASYKARASIRELPCSNLAGIAAKLSWLLAEDADNASLEPYGLVVRDLATILGRPTQDAFAAKLRDYHEAVGALAGWETINRPADYGKDGLTPRAAAYEEGADQHRSKVYDAGHAVMLEPAPDIAALLEKRAIFDELRMQDDDESPVITHALFDDAVRLAGGVA